MVSSGDWRRRTHELLPDLDEWGQPRTAFATLPVFSLRDIAALKVAKDFVDIPDSVLSELPFLCVKRIWKHILTLRIDSFESFCRVAKLGRCAAHNSRDGSVRGWMIAEGKIPLCCHRMETVPMGTPLRQLLAPLPFDQLTILDLEGVQNSEWGVLGSFSLLVALNISNTSIDDTYVYGLCRSIELGKLGKLLVVVVNDCPHLTKAGIWYIVGLDKGLVCYVETNHDLQVMSRQFDSNLGLYYDIVHSGYRAWFKLDGERNDIGVIFRQSLALKLVLIWKRFSGTNLCAASHPHLEKIRSQVIIDFKMADSWHDRRGRMRQPNAYMVYDNGMTKKKAVKASVQPATKASAVLRKKLMNVSANDFFGLK